MSVYGGYITPEQAVALGDTRALEELKAAARSKGKCMVCKAPTASFNVAL